jgi:hypothetical protein
MQQELKSLAKITDLLELSDSSLPRFDSDFEVYQLKEQEECKTWKVLLSSCISCSLNKDAHPGVSGATALPTVFSPGCVSTAASWGLGLRTHHAWLRVILYFNIVNLFLCLIYKLSCIITVYTWEKIAQPGARWQCPRQGCAIQVLSTLSTQDHVSLSSSNTRLRD